jgi:hypothetical protein
MPVTGALWGKVSDEFAVPPPPAMKRNSGRVYVNGVQRGDVIATAWVCGQAQPRLHSHAAKQLNGHVLEFQILASCLVLAMRTVAHSSANHPAIYCETGIQKLVARRPHRKYLVGKYRWEEDDRVAVWRNIYKHTLIATRSQ